MTRSQRLRVAVASLLAGVLGFSIYFAPPSLSVQRLDGDRGAASALPLTPRESKPVRKRAASGSGPTRVLARAVPDATVCLVGSRGQPRCGRTSEDGDLLFERVAPGAYEAVANASEGTFRALRFEVPPGQDTEVFLDIPVNVVPGGDIQGTVMDASGGAIAGATVSAMTPAGELAGGSITDTMGTYRLRVGLGPYTLVATADGYARSSVAIEAPAPFVRIALTAAGGLSGIVVSRANAEGQEAVAVQATPRGNPAERPTFARTDADGAFRLQQLLPGEYALRLTTPPWYAPVQLVSVPPGGDVGPVTIEAEVGQTVQGFVTVNGSPCEHGQVRLIGTIPLVADTDADGSVRLSGVPAGPYLAAVSCRGATNERFSLVVQPDHNPSFEWPLVPGATLLVRVSGRDHDESLGWRVRVQGPSPSDTERDCKAVESEFECEGLGLGRYSVSLVSREGRAIGDPTQVELSTLGVNRVDLAPPSGARVVVVLPDHAASLAGLQVRALRDNVNVGVAGRVALGRFQFTLLEPGQYQLVVGGSDCKEQSSVAIQVNDGVDLQQVALDDVPTATLRGRVVDAEGLGVPDVWVHPWSRDNLTPGTPGDPAPVLTDDDGSFEIQNVVCGTYSARFESAGGSFEIETLSTSSATTLILDDELAKEHGSAAGRGE